MALRDRHLVGKAKAGAVSLSLILGACAMSAATEGGAKPVPPDATSPFGAYLAARHAQQQRDYPAAATYMDKALAGDPGNFDLMRRDFLFRLGDGRVTDAVPLATRLADLDRNSSFAQLVLALRDFAAGKFTDALTRVTAMPREGAERFSGPLLAAWAEVGQQRAAPALLILAEAANGKGLDELVQLHRALIADYADRIDEAAEAYEKLTLNSKRLTWRTVELAGNFFERHQRVGAARQVYERLRTDDASGALIEGALKRLESGVTPPRIIASPKDGAAEAMFDIASLLNQRDTFDASMLYANLAISLRADFPMAQLLLAEIADEEQRREDALELYRAIDRGSPLAWSARLREAALLDQLDHVDDATALLGRMGAERANDPEPLIELGDVLRGHNRYPDAIAAYDGAIARVKTVQARHWRLYYSRGVAYERSRQWPRAEADLRRALELQPEQPLVLNYLGYSWIDQGVHLDEALKMVERAVSLRPNDGYIVDSLGWAYFHLGNYAKATEHLEHAIELVPEDPTINDHLGDAYWRMGRRDEARFQWRRALQFKPETAEATKIGGKLEHGLDSGQAASATRGG